MLTYNMNLDLDLDLDFNLGNLFQKTQNLDLLVNMDSYLDQGNLLRLDRP